MSATAAQLDAAERALKSIEDTRRGAWTEALGTWSADPSAKAAAVSFFEKTVPAAMDALRRRLDKIDSDSDWSRWVSDANALYKSIADVAGYRTEWSMLNVLYSAGKQTVIDVGTGAGQIASAAKSGTAWGIAAALLVLYVAWRAS